LFRFYSARMLALSDDQLAIVMTAAGGLPVEKRGTFLERVAARLTLRGRFNDADLDDAVHVALHGLSQDSAA
jgi:hypothetical protein